jgi:predicted CopG family antitoxin
MDIRESELKLCKRVGITEECYRILRSAKKKENKSMARIVNDLITQKYGDKNI